MIFPSLFFFKEVVCLEDSRPESPLFRPSNHIHPSKQTAHYSSFLFFFFLFLKIFIIFTSCVFLLIILSDSFRAEFTHWPADSAPGRHYPLQRDGGFCLQHPSSKTQTLRFPFRSGRMTARNPTRLRPGVQRVSEPISVCVKCRMLSKPETK